MQKITCIGAALLLSAACGRDSAPAPAATTAPRQVIATFHGVANPATGQLAITLDGAGGQRALITVPVDQNGVGGDAPPSTVELSNASAPGVVSAACAGGVDGWGGDVAVRSFFAANALYDVYLVLDTISGTNHDLCSGTFSPEPSAISDAVGVAAVGKLGVAGTGSDTRTTSLIFKHLDDTAFTFSGHVLAAVATPTGGGPAAIAIESHVWIANGGATTLTELNPDGSVVGTWTVGNGPSGVAYDGSKLWVSNNGGSSVTEVDPSTGATLTECPVGDNATAVAAFDAHVFVGTLGGSVLTLDPSNCNNVLATANVGSQVNALVPDAVNHLLYVVTRGTPPIPAPVVVLDAFTGAITTSWDLAPLLQAGVLGGANLYVASYNNGTVLQVRVSDGAVLQTWPVCTYPQALSWDGSRVWVACGGIDTVYAVDPSSGATLATFATGSSPQALGNDGSALWIADTFSNDVIRLQY